MKTKIFSINVSKKKGTAKAPVESARLLEGHGLDGDAHAGVDDIRQVSLLAFESIIKQNESLKASGAAVILKPGDFGENITTLGIDLLKLKIGDLLRFGNETVLEISKIGKECHGRCAIYYRTGDCIMPREGIFAKVLKGGTVVAGDKIEAVDNA